MSIRDLVRPHIRELQPYPPGKPIEELERELGIQKSVKLASNESPLGPSARVLEAIQRALPEVHRYPDGASHALRQALARHLSVTPEQLVFGTGADEILELVVKTFLAPGDEAVYPWPSFAMYPVVTLGMGGKPVPVPVAGPDFTLDVGALLAAVTPRTRIVFLANPNNPTGTSIGKRDFDALLEGLPGHVILVADEAYFEYARRPDFPDALARIPSQPGLLVMRTFSKAWGLAGLRVGYGVGQAELCGYLERARHPFNVNLLAQRAAEAALGDLAHVDRVRQLTHAGLRQLEAGFRELDLAYVPSDANFVLVDVARDARALYDALLRRGVITRPLAAFGLTQHLRVTAGLPEENERFLAALRAELGR